MCNKLQGLFYKFLKLKLSSLSAYCSAHVKCLCLLITIAHRGINHGSKSGGRTCETRRAEARSPTGWERGEVLGRGQPAPSPSSHPPLHQLGAEGLGERCNWKLPQRGSGRHTHTSRNPPVFTAFTWPIGQLARPYKRTSAIFETAARLLCSVYCGKVAGVQHQCELFQLNLIVDWSASQVGLGKNISYQHEHLCYV